jgi:hypothetical protein
MYFANYSPSSKQNGRRSKRKKASNLFSKRTSCTKSEKIKRVEKKLPLGSQKYFRKETTMTKKIIINKWHKRKLSAKKIFNKRFPSEKNHHHLLLFCEM